jgi:hypothetical protein
MSSKTNAITFAFRKPTFPVICDLDGDLFAAECAAGLPRLLAKVHFTIKKICGSLIPEGSAGAFKKADDLCAGIFPEDVA